MKCIVGTTNPVKLAAVEKGASVMFPESQVSVSGVDVPTGVSRQPMTSEETYQGALNRVKAAKSQNPDADFWFGVEAGLEKDQFGMSSFAWAVALDTTGNVGRGKSATFYLPSEIVELIEQGIELGKADDMVFGTTNSKQGIGAIGILTRGAYDRTALYVPAVLISLIPFVQVDLYRSDSRGADHS